MFVLQQPQRSKNGEKRLSYQRFFLAFKWLNMKSSSRCNRRFLFWSEKKKWEKCTRAQPNKRDIVDHERATVHTKPTLFFFLFDVDTKCLFILFFFSVLSRFFPLVFAFRAQILCGWSCQQFRLSSLLSICCFIWVFFSLSLHWPSQGIMNVIASFSSSPASLLSVRIISWRQIISVAKDWWLLRLQYENWLVRRSIRRNREKNSETDRPTKILEETDKWWNWLTYILCRSRAALTKKKIKSFIREGTKRFAAMRFSWDKHSKERYRGERQEKM